MAEKRNYKTWMADLPTRLLDVPISCLAIPGSHDSGTSNLDLSLGIAVDQPGIVKALGKTCCGTSAIYRWSKTQNLTVAQQLEAGIRYLDFRVANHPTTHELRLVHGLYGDPVLQTLHAVRSFVDENPEEIVILDFNHFYNMTPKEHSELLKSVREVFGGKLVPAPDHSAWLPRWGMTLRSLWATDFRVIVIYHHEHASGACRDIWPQYSLDSPWPNTTRTDDLISFVEDIYTNGRRFRNDNLYNWQGILTPSTKTVVFHLANTLEKFLSDEASSKFVSWLKHQTPGPREINICSTDFVEKFDFIPTVIGLNDKVFTYPKPLSFDSG